MKSLRERLDTAIAHLKEALRLYPSNHRYRSVLAEAHLCKGEVSDAITHLVEAVHPTTGPRATYLLALGLAATRSWADAERMATDALLDSPGLDRALYVRGRARIELGRFDLAAADFDAAASLAPQVVEYALAGARLLLSRAGRPEPARVERFAKELRALAREGDVTEEVQCLADRLAEQSDGSGASERRPKPTWPDLLSPSLNLLDHQSVLPLPEEYPRLLPPDDASWKLSLDFHNGNGHTRTCVDLGDLLQRGRRSLSQDDVEAAIPPLEEGFRRAVREGRDDTIGQLLQGLAEALSVAYTKSRSPHNISDEELYDAGARYAPFLKQLARRLLADSRSDPAALEMYVTCVEHTPNPALRLRLLRTLARGLRIDLTDVLEDLDIRVSLLERLHRSRPHLVFPLLYLGHYHYRRRDFTTARVLFDAVGGGLAESPRTILLRARCSEKTGNTDLAIELYAASLKRRHALPAAHFRLGRLLLKGAPVLAKVS